MKKILYSFLLLFIHSSTILIASAPAYYYSPRRAVWQDDGTERLLEGLKSCSKMLKEELKAKLEESGMTFAEWLFKDYGVLPEAQSIDHIPTIESKKLYCEGLILPLVWKQKNATFKQLWAQAESNADRVYILEEAIKAAKTEKELQGLDAYLQESSLLAYDLEIDSSKLTLEESARLIQEYLKNN